jgi:hypothetical protein
VVYPNSVTGKARTPSSIGKLFDERWMMVDDSVAGNPRLAPYDSDECLRLNELNIERDGHVFADQDATGFEGRVPGQTAVFAVDSRLHDPLRLAKGAVMAVSSSCLVGDCGSATFFAS